MPAHEWSGTELRFQNPDGSWGDYSDLQGPGAGDPPPTPEVLKDGYSFLVNNEEEKENGNVERVAKVGLITREEKGE